MNKQVLPVEPDYYARFSPLGLLKLALKNAMEKYKAEKGEAKEK